jgi:hypothetical protein
MTDQIAKTVPPQSNVVQFPDGQPLGKAQHINQEVITKHQLRASNSAAFSVGLEIADEAAGLLKRTRHPLYLMLAVKRLLPEYQARELQDGFFTRGFEIAPEWGEREGDFLNLAKEGGS